MDIGLRRMRPPAPVFPAGAHDSHGWQVDTPWHHHDMHQLLYAFEGSVEVEGHRGRYKIPHQFAAWIPAGAVHRTTIQKVASGSVFLAPAMVACDDDAPRVIVAPVMMREMILHAMRWPVERVEDDAVSGAFFQAFAALCGEWIAQEVKLVLPASVDPRIKAIIAHTRKHIAEVTLAGLCRAIAMSERSLRRHFRAALGISWEEYRFRLRLCLAIDALEDSDRPIASVAADVGYDDPAAFARAFRAVMGLSPSDYRRRKCG
jgi:AraC-like DNA-binding protein